MNQSVLQVCRHFSKADILAISSLGNGLINQTYYIKTSAGEFVLQQINKQVFPKPELIMKNLMLLNLYVRQRVSRQNNLRIPAVIPTLKQQGYFLEDNQFWRALEYIKNSESREKITCQQEAVEIGLALGRFHCLFSNAPIQSFHDTLPGFHIAPDYYQSYLRAINNFSGEGNQNHDFQFCTDFIDRCQSMINVLEQAKNTGQLVERIIHGDPKLNNFLFDRQSNSIVSLVDLDTVKPGLVHYDIADCLRSSCHHAENNTFDVALFTVILNSYLQQASVFFTEQDYQFLFPAIQLMPLELGIRFFTDYLQGNRYFKVDTPEQNLYKAVAQFRLCASIMKQEAEIKGVIENCKQNNIHLGTRI